MTNKLVVPKICSKTDLCLVVTGFFLIFKSQFKSKHIGESAVPGWRVAGQRARQRGLPLTAMQRFAPLLRKV